MNTAW